MREFIEQDIEQSEASLGRRLAAMFYDTLLNIALLMVTTGIYMMIVKAVIGDQVYREMNDAGSTIGDPVLTFVLFATLFLFYGYFWTRTGQTLGMQVWHLRVQTLDQKPISLLQALVRFIGALISAFAFGIGYIWILFDKQNRTLHCILSKTQVVRIPKRQK